MAAPTVTSYSWNPVTLSLKMIWSEAVSAGSAFAAGNIDLTDANGRRYISTGAFTGTGTATITQPMTLSGVAETASTVDILAGTFKNGATTDNAAIVDAAIYTTIGHAAPFNHYDFDRMIAIITAAANGTLDLTAGAAVSDLATFSASAFATAMVGLPIVAAQAVAAMSAFDSFLQSSRDPSAERQLTQAMQALRIVLPASTTYAITPVGT